MSREDARQRAVEWVMNARNGEQSASLAIPAGDDPAAFAAEVQDAESMLSLLGQLPAAPVPAGLADRTFRLIRTATPIAGLSDVAAAVVPEQ